MGVMACDFLTIVCGLLIGCFLWTCLISTLSWVSCEVRDGNFCWFFFFGSTFPSVCVLVLLSFAGFFFFVAEYVFSSVSTFGTNLGIVFVNFGEISWWISVPTFIYLFIYLFKRKVNYWESTTLCTHHRKF